MPRFFVYFEQFYAKVRYSVQYNYTSAVPGLA